MPVRCGRALTERGEIDVIGAAPAGGRRLNSGWDLFWILNILNVADAVLTWLVVEAGIAREANPVVRSIGAPGKVFLVGMAGFLLMRIRPRALWIPIGALGAAVLWTLGGWLYFS